MYKRASNTNNAPVKCTVRTVSFKTLAKCHFHKSTNENTTSQYEYGVKASKSKCAHIHFKVIIKSLNGHCDYN